MRPGQNGKRPRRGRKPQHFTNRTFDSSGPEVKIRGTAAHIYEKYQALARDSNAAGDRIGAENYLQHAEHYYRILATFQPQPGQPGQPGQQGQGFNNNGRFPQQPGDGPQPQMGNRDEDGPDDGDQGEDADDGEEVRA